MANLLCVFGESSTKGKIIELLSEKWPLTAKKIYNQLAKRHRLSITYQAAHKALKELTEDKVLEKRKEGYLLNKEWVKNLGDFSERIGGILEQAGKNRVIKTIQKLTFDNHREFIKFHRDFIEELIKKEKKLDMVFHYRHIPFPYVMSNEELKRMRSLMPKLKWTILAKKDTVVGRWLAKQWNKIGVKTKIGVDIAEDRLMILNDYIFYVYTSKEAIDLWDKNYSVKNIKDFDTTIVNDAVLNPKYKPL